MQSKIEAWKGEFGDAYHERQTDVRTEAGKREKMWAQVLDRMPRVDMDILEVGAGTGANLEAIHRMRPDFYLCALEPNKKALDAIRFDVIHGTADSIQSKDSSFDFVFTYGVLIHLDDPLAAMREMYRVSSRFVMCAEYFSPKRERIPYRSDNSPRGGPVPLFKDDYGALWMDNFDLKLLGYGFAWKRATGLDNVTWWLFEKITSATA